MKTILALCLLALSEVAVAQVRTGRPASASPASAPSLTASREILFYIGFGEAQAAQLVAATRVFIHQPPSVPAANQLTGSIMRAMTVSRPYYLAARQAAVATGRPELVVAIEAFRAEEQQLPYKLGNTDETRLDGVVSTLKASGDRVVQELRRSES